MKARVAQVDRDAKNNIVFLEDLSNTHVGMSITNDAEAVVDNARSIYGNSVRVVYKDSDGEWWELDWYMHDPGRTDVRFKRWYGLVWDKLTKV